MMPFFFSFSTLTDAYTVEPAYDISHCHANVAAEVGQAYHKTVEKVPKHPFETRVSRTVHHPVGPFLRVQSQGGEKEKATEGSPKNIPLLGFER